jgi:hypothetical protein
LRPEVLDLLRILTRTGTPAMRARGRLLLRRLEAAPGHAFTSPASLPNRKLD